MSSLIKYIRYLFNNLLDKILIHLSSLFFSKKDQSLTGILE